MKIEAGKYYKTRDGRKVGPITKGQEPYKDGRPAPWPFRFGIFWYRSDGFSCPGEAQLHNDDDDLISEWVETTDIEVGAKYIFLDPHSVDTTGAYFTKGKSYMLKYINRYGEPVLIDKRGKEHEWAIGHFKLSFKKECLSPIRTVTRLEIVPGSYGVIQVHKDGKIGMLPSVKSADQLREAAHILNQIAEVLEENGK